MYKANLQGRAVVAIWSVELNLSSITTPRLSWKELEGDEASSSQKCLSDRLQCEQLLSDHLIEMRGRVECHQHSSDRTNHASE